MSTRRTLALVLALLAATAALMAGGAGAQETAGTEPDAVLVSMGAAFTYQGRLVDAGNPAAGVYDFQFRLYNAASGGGQIGALQAVDNVGVSGGLFTVAPDFGAGAFDGQARWLEIAVKRDADGSYTTLSPRVALTPAPHALALPGLWTQQNATSPNLIGGYAGNVMSAGVQGGVIAGGGLSGNPNSVYDQYNTVGGGLGNVAGVDDVSSTNQTFATVAGGQSNTASNRHATVSGGSSNTASSTWATVGGGYLNTASGTRAVVGGGENNQASNSYTTIGGGYLNTASGYAAVAGGGWYNLASKDYATVSGGRNNQAAGAYATIAGGGPSDTANPVTTNNRIYDDYGSIGGGGGNVVGTDDTDPTNQTFATIAGGRNNVAANSYATVGGGLHNAADGYTSWVGGGAGNDATGSHAAISGGSSNAAGGNYAAVGGGFGNTASGYFATAPGGMYGVASHYGELAYASGRFAAVGDAQTSLYVLRQETGDATLNELFLDGSAERITLAADRVMTFDILVVGSHRFGGGSSAGYQVIGVIRNIGGATSFVGTPVTTVLGENVAGWDVQVEANDTVDALVVKVQGSSATSVRWVASVRTVEVGR
jgi:hypothetical protein